jgi:hypothetical protein
VGNIHDAWFEIQGATTALLPENSPGSEDPSRERLRVCSERHHLVSGAGDQTHIDRYASSSPSLRSGWASVARCARRLIREKWAAEWMSRP